MPQASNPTSIIAQLPALPRRISSRRRKQLLYRLKEPRFGVYFTHFRSDGCPEFTPYLHYAPNFPEARVIELARTLCALGVEVQIVPGSRKRLVPFQVIAAYEEGLRYAA